MTNGNYNDTKKNEGARTGKTMTRKTTLLTSDHPESATGFLYCDPKGNDPQKMLELTDEQEEEVVWDNGLEGEDDE